jgi:hypothetical protein
MIDISGEVHKDGDYREEYCITRRCAAKRDNSQEKIIEQRYPGDPIEKEVMSCLEPSENYSGKCKGQREDHEHIVIPGDQAAKLEKSTIRDQDMEKNDEIYDEKVPEDQVKGSRERVIFITMRAGDQGKTSSPQVIPGCEIIFTDNRKIHGIGLDVMPVPDQGMVKREKRCVQDD